MTDYALPRATLGGNNPPPEDLAEMLAEQHATLIEQQGDHELAASALPKEVKADADVEAVTAWVVKARALAKAAETERETAKRPVLERGRAIDSFFNAIRDGLRDKAAAVERRNAPYLAAKAEAARRERERIEAEKRAAAEEARRRQGEEAEAARRAEREADEARRRVAEAQDQESIDAAAEAVRQAELQAQLAREAEEQAQKDAQAAEKSADRDARAAAGGALAKTGSETGSANVRQEWRFRVANQGDLIRSLGPLGQYLGDTAVTEALRRAMKAEPKPVIPGVEFFTETVAKTTARRGS